MTTTEAQLAEIQQYLNRTCLGFLRYYYRTDLREDSINSAEFMEELQLLKLFTLEDVVRKKQEYESTHNFCETYVYKPITSFGELEEIYSDSVLSILSVQLK